MNYKLDPQESVQTSSPRQTKQPHSHGRRLIFHVILIGALAFAGIPLWRAYQDQVAAEQAYQEVKAGQEQAVEENREVFQATQQMKEPAYLEDVARRDYYYTKPGEIIFELGSSHQEDTKHP